MINIDQLKEFIKTNLFGSSLIFLGLIFVLGSLFISVKPNEQALVTSDKITPATDFHLNISPTDLPEIKVDIEGAVVNPGVYTLPASSRVQDAVQAAGGFSSQADETKITSGLNLAAKINDASKIYIPVLGDGQDVVMAGTSSSDSQFFGGKVNLNTASESELDALPGIGPVTAQKIISNRPYSQVSDLQAKKIVKSNVYTQIEDKVTTQ